MSMAYDPTKVYTSQWLQNVLGESVEEFIECLCDEINFRLQDMREKYEGVEIVGLDLGGNDDDGGYIELTVSRSRTPEEIAAQAEVTRKNAEAQRVTEYQTYLRLRAKFEPDLLDQEKGETT